MKHGWQPDEPENKWWWVANYYAATLQKDEKRMTELKDGAWEKHRMILGATWAEGTVFE